MDLIVEKPDYCTYLDFSITYGKHTYNRQGVWILLFKSFNLIYIENFKRVVQVQRMHPLNDIYINYKDKILIFS